MYMIKYWYYCQILPNTTDHREILHKLCQGNAELHEVV